MKQFYSERIQAFVRDFYKTGFVFGVVLLASCRGGIAVAQGVDGLHKLPPVEVKQEALSQKPDDSTLFIPCSEKTGIAAFWSGSEFIIIADSTNLNLSSLKKVSGPFVDQTITILDHATLISFRLPEHPDLRMLRDDRGWKLEVGPVASGVRLVPHIEPGLVTFPLVQPGRVLSFPDPATGARLLVATSRVASGGVSGHYNGVGYRIRPSAEGVVILADSDQLMLSLTPNNAVLYPVESSKFPVGRSLLQPKKDPEQNQDWVFLGLQNAPEQELKQRQKTAEGKLAQATEQQRPELLFAAARAALAAGSVVAAQEFISQADHSENSDIINSPANRFLSAVVALLNGNTKAAALLGDPKWSGVSELAVWRAFYGLQIGKSSKITVPELADHAEQIKRYPSGLRDLILPGLAAAVIRYGSDESLRKLGKIPDGSAYDLVRALLLVRQKQTHTAQLVLRSMAASPSVDVSSAAHVLQIRLGERAGLIQPEEAVQQYIALQKGEDEAGIVSPPSRQILYLGLSRALTQVGQYRTAMITLSFLLPGPEVPGNILEDAYLALIKKMVSERLRSLGGSKELSSEMHEQVSDTVALAGQNLPFLTDGPEKAGVLLDYGRLLMALGELPHAQQIFSQAMVMFPDPRRRNEALELMIRAALREGNNDQAQHLLEKMQVKFLSSDLTARKTYDEALLARNRGDMDKALALLAHDETDDGLDLRGQLYEATYQWPQAILVIGRLANRLLPQNGELTDSQKSLAVRLMTDAVSAHDTDTLQRLKSWLAGRSVGKQGDILLERQFQGAMIRPKAH